MAVLRSRKYRQLSDAEILKRFKDQPVGEDLHFLQIELEQRDLAQQADQVLQEVRKKARHSVLYYLFYALMFGFFVARFGSDFI
ncbi:hypothetical protein GB2207_01582 [gamma proteobacterium HTCC2207]|jgi:hypothetical protein|uniref:Uncharacterized protein n=1 Tax=gamma proteobacterium HTCC2207 TaxID=314287 RepID=Q1YTN3_9GAMM|nr:hypothetical protein GB2207_01582 [gamma proteobacterium HTCC2207]MBT5104804.1 hypothetical protein [Porticoccaceae bacterium]MBT6115716.1 hypothetical protein [Porticoccaceae bacterium]MBT6592453.1 hypothetical protein [Porticoccaceae bacterium]MDG1079857.1 hypothetical protein [Porticoccaceae bacterium]